MLQSRTAIFNSPLGERVSFHSLTGQEALGRLFIYEVDLLSEDDSIDLSELLGQPAAVFLERIDGSLREFNGFVSHFSLVGQLRNLARYRAVLRPWFWFLGQNRKSRIFQREKVPDVVQALFREHGFSDFESALSDSEYRKWEYLVQYRESDLNFVSRILEQEGIHYFFKHEGGKHTLVLADSNTAHKTSPGYETVPFFPPEHEHRKREHLDTWVASRQIRPGRFSAADFNFKNPSIVASTVRSPLEHGYSDYELFDYPGEFDESADADAQVKIRLEEHQVDYETFQGGGPVRGLMAGSRFTLSEFPREDQNRDYLVVRANYQIRVSDYESHLEGGDSEPDFAFQFVGIDAKRPFRVARSTKKPTVEGPQTAIVVGPENQEILTDEYGRVKVQFHWDRLGQYDEDSSCWVRVSQVWAGANWGAMHIPRIGQEVIVDFLEGDPDRPIITGRVYNQAQMPPYKLPDNATQSGIKSRSSKGGAPDNFNEIRFEDKKGQEELFVQAEKNMTTLVKNDRTATILRNDTLNIQGDQFIHIHGNLSMTVDGVTDKQNPDPNSKIKSAMSVTGQHTMHASDTIDLDAPNHIKLTVGGSSITITPGGIVLSAGGGASISIDSKIAAVAAGKGELRLDAKVNAKSADGSLLTLDPNAFLKGSGGGSVLVDENILSKSAGGSTALVDASSVKLDATKIAATGKAEVALAGGASTLKLTPASADLKGAVTNVQGTGMVSIAATLVKIN